MITARRPFGAFAVALTRLALRGGLLISLVMVSLPAFAAADDWLYFDLGGVIVSGNPTDGYTYVPGALTYLAAARAQGYKVALITNIPEAWGATCGEKFAKLQTFLGTRLHESEPMDWTQFDAVIVPPFDRYRKPQPFSFVAGLKSACPGRALYVGEVAGEVDAAKALGFATFQAPTAPGTDPFPALASVAARLARGFHFQEPDACDFAAIFGPILAPEDRATGVDPCIVNPQSPD